MSEIQLDGIAIKTQAESYIHFDKVAKTFNEMKKNYHLIKQSNVDLNDELKKYKENQYFLGNVGDISFTKDIHYESNNYEYRFRIGNHSISYQQNRIYQKFDEDREIVKYFEYQIDNFLKDIKNKAIDVIMKDLQGDRNKL